MSGLKYLKGRCQHCGGPLEFSAETIGMSADCPHCGQATELMLEAPEVESGVPRRWLVMAIVAVVVLLGGLFACMAILKRYEHELARRKEQAAAASPSPGPTEAAKSVGQSEGTNGFQVSAISLEKTPGSSLVYAVGTVKNTANRQRFGVRVELDLLDAAGQKVGTAKDYQQVVEPGGEWRFKALVVEGKAVAATLAAVQEEQ